MSGRQLPPLPRKDQHAVKGELGRGRVHFQEENEPPIYIRREYHGNCESMVGDRPVIVKPGDFIQQLSNDETDELGHPKLPCRGSLWNWDASFSNQVPSGNANPRYRFDDCEPICVDDKRFHPRRNEIHSTPQSHSLTPHVYDRSLHPRRILTPTLSPSSFDRNSNETTRPKLTGPRPPLRSSQNNLKKQRRARVDDCAHDYVYQERVRSKLEVVRQDRMERQGEEMKRKTEVEEFRQRIHMVYPDMIFDGEVGGVREWCCAVM